MIKYIFSALDARYEAI